LNPGDSSKPDLNLKISAMPLKTCLLISGDPDDHEILSEALKELSDNIILIACRDGRHAQDLLFEGNITLDFLIIDVSIEGLNAEELLYKLKYIKKFHGIPTAFITEHEPQILTDSSDRIYFSRNNTYSSVKNILRQLITKAEVR
jgi:hypothetical protein